MPYAPEPRRRPWLPAKKEQSNQGRAFRTKEYDTPRWRKCRELFLAAHPLCVECRKAGKVTAASVVDHIVRVNAGGEFWNEDNWQPLCKSCHQRKSARERHGK